MVAEGATMLTHLREQADAGTEAVLGTSDVDDAAVNILQRLGFPRSRHRTQVCSVARFLPKAGRLCPEQLACMTAALAGARGCLAPLPTHGLHGLPTYICA